MSLTPAPAPLSASEAERRRLARLRMLAVLDTEPEPVFDALVRIAAVICGTPIALMTLVDEQRQWFKANLGLDGLSETPRDVAFCDHAIRGEEVLEIPDATRDRRFQANPLVTGSPGIRFYAGAPIAMPSGERIGTICVINREPASLTPQQQSALRDLAEVAQWALLQRERLHDLTVVGDESRFQAISYASPLGIFQADAQGAVFHLNGRGQEILGQDQDHALGLGWQDVVAEEDRGAVRAAWQEAVQRREPIAREFRITRGDGEGVWVRMEARPGRWGEPPRSGFVGVIGDISERRAAEAAAREAKEAAEAASRAKSDFLDNVSHEIRTPLNGVLGLTRLLLAEELTPQQRRYVQLADASAASLLELINDLLDLGKIESGRMELEDAPFRLHDLLQQLGELYRLRADEKGLRFVLEIEPDVPRSAIGDAGRLRQVLNNLLSNACKFTTQGEFGLLVSRADAGRGSGMLRFTVWDTGIGIPYDVQQRLFRRFTQADSSTARRFGGTGLGLAIVRQLCEMMGGTVLLQSEPGRGASFRCELPLRAVSLPELAHATAAAARPAARHATRVLVAEDNETNQVVVRGLLAQAGYADVTIVGDGQQAVDAVTSSSYDLVLMDCRMPVMDGYEASRRLRAAGCTLPIIALTANAAAGERDRCLAWGMNEYLAKPIDPVRLAQVLAEWTGNEAAAAPVPAATSADAAAPAFDRAHALERMGGDEELLEVALASFRQHAPRVLASAGQALAVRGQADLHRHLHSLAGSAGMVGAQTIQVLAQRLEAHASEGGFEAVEQGLPELHALLARFLEESAGW